MKMKMNHEKCKLFADCSRSHDSLLLSRELFRHIRFSLSLHYDELAGVVL